ncbi:MAG TPA: hypothetical protein VFX36_07410 [Nitrospira sp.]|nr:hypothetical protein [Nitrospira sp.]
MSGPANCAEKGEPLMLPLNVMRPPWFCLCCLQWFQRDAPVCMVVPGHAFQGSVCRGCKIKDEYCRAKLPATSYHDRMRQLTGLNGVALTDYIKGRLT